MGKINHPLNATAGGPKSAKKQRERRIEMETYKPIKRRYYEGHSIFESSKEGTFVARGQWADGHLAYSRLDEQGNEIEGEECAYVQLRGAIMIDRKVVARQYMQRV